MDAPFWNIIDEIAAASIVYFAKRLEIAERELD
jgi:hypothetical protein